MLVGKQNEDKNLDFVFGDAYSERRKNRFVQITERANVAPRHL